MNNKYIFFILLSLILYSCYEKSDMTIIYRVEGTKTNLNIKYRGVSNNGIIDEELTSVHIDKLPFDMKLMEKKRKSNTKEWFLSSSSDSEGYMTVIIDHYKEPYVYDKTTDISKTTTSNYVEIYGKWDK